MEKKWGEYPTSPELLFNWSAFLFKWTARASSPAFYQFVTHTVFKAVIKQKIEVSDSTAELQQHPLTGDDESGLCYVAGYLCCKVRTCLESFSNPNKNDMNLTVIKFRGNEIESESAHQRGGLMPLGVGISWIFNIDIHHCKIEFNHRK